MEVSRTPLFLSNNPKYTYIFIILVAFSVVAAIEMVVHQIKIRQKIEDFNNFQAQDISTSLCSNICSHYIYQEDYQSVECCLKASTHYKCISKQTCYDLTVNQMQISVENEILSYKMQVGAMIFCIFGGIFAAICLYKKWIVSIKQRNLTNKTQESFEKILDDFIHIDLEDKCAICLQDFNHQKAIRLPCNHIFHSLCGRIWLEKHPTCPICRARNDGLPNR